jgi:hypothetical protein
VALEMAAERKTLTPAQLEELASLLKKSRDQ